MTIVRAHLILYVRDQAASTAFFRTVLGVAPTLEAAGMTELPLPGGAVLGLMPEGGIVRLLGERARPASPGGGTRAELYLVVDDAARYHARALSAGARELDAPRVRDWGHRAGYCLDPDGHVLAFAEELAGG